MSASRRCGQFFAKSDKIFAEKKYIFKKMRISKEKLAWIIDCTASPVCVLIPFIGWGVTSMGLIQTELDNLGITAINDWTAFCNAIPYQIYPIFVN